MERHSPLSPPPGDLAALQGRTIVLGVAGGIAAYKAAELVRLLRKAGAQVFTAMTAAAQQFLTPLTLQTLSGNPVATQLFDLTQESQIGHIALADRADLLLLAPATANLIGRLAHGLADDVLTTLALACQAPLLLCPAMNVNMWDHPAVQENVQRLVGRGARLCGPDAGELACGWVGRGRLSDPAQIVAAAAQLLAEHAGRSGSAAVDPGAAQDLAGVRLLVSAGPTYEPIDPVRFLGNRSSGKMGFALARAAARRGAQVTLVAGPVALATPPGVTRIDVETAAQMAQAILPRAAAQDVIIMAAAVADYRPATLAGDKLKKDTLGAAPQLALTPTTDILAELGRARVGPRPLLVGFAAETTDLLRHAAGKLRRKGCDLLVANDVSAADAGFAVDTNRVVLLALADPAAPTPSASDPAADDLQVERLPLLSKDAVADEILHRVARRVVIGR